MSIVALQTAIAKTRKAAAKATSPDVIAQLAVTAAALESALGAYKKTKPAIVPADLDDDEDIQDPEKELEDPDDDEDKDEPEEGTHAQRKAAHVARLQKAATVPATRKAASEALAALGARPQFKVEQASGKTPFASAYQFDQKAKRMVPRG